ncbi:hypothetical protein ABIB37_000800 [Agrococcus sp. UYP10]|uniref:hypothetical protein n=1 Tax=Agrococcus sp. UYP10 TaxID=1756355 RepID=UPI00339181F8
MTFVPASVRATGVTLLAAYGICHALMARLKGCVDWYLAGRAAVPSCAGQASAEETE